MGRSNTSRCGRAIKCKSKNSRNVIIGYHWLPLTNILTDGICSNVFFFYCGFVTYFAFVVEEGACDLKIKYRFRL